MVLKIINRGIWAGVLMGLGFTAGAATVSAERPGGPVRTTRAARSGPATGDYRVAVTDYGAVPDSRRDAVPAIRRALAACRGRSHAVLVFPRGRYDLYP